MLGEGPLHPTPRRAALTRATRDLLASAEKTSHLGVGLGKLVMEGDVWGGRCCLYKLVLIQKNMLGMMVERCL